MIVVMLTLVKMVICSPLANGDGGDYNGDGDLLTMYAKAIPTPLAIVTEFRKVPLFQRNNSTKRGKSWIAVKSRRNGIGVQKFAEPPSEINLRFVEATSHMKSIPAIYQT